MTHELIQYDMMSQPGIKSKPNLTMLQISEELKHLHLSIGMQEKLRTEKMKSAALLIAINFMARRTPNEIEGIN